MSSITEQFSAATKSQLEAQFQILSTLASTAVGSAEKVFALNLSTTKASVEKSSAAAKKLLTATDPKEFFSLNAAEPASFDGLLAYSRELYSIASSAQDQLIKSAQSTLKQVTDLAATKATVLPKIPVLTSVIAANEPVVVAPKAPKVKPAAPKVIEVVDVEPVAEEDTFIEVKAETKPSFPSVPPKPIALSPEDKPAKSAPKAKK
ncbi:TIGR01841 family phasin [Duganella sp. FT135W]|uniref:TIGR01841 family phasin n=1 Tax=Duganella flavida TaxID=2692175 RepID=A0A6L8KBV5_9BURK|nr:phasin family protein [Duganella flavida]MYM24167.1 TIGR01841 family phasin [Duganella flavida]